jgi:hypothetical protein
MRGFRRSSELRYANSRRCCGGRWTARTDFPGPSSTNCWRSCAAVKRSRQLGRNDRKNSRRGRRFPSRRWSPRDVLPDSGQPVFSTKSAILQHQRAHGNGVERLLRRGSGVFDAAVLSCVGKKKLASPLVGNQNISARLASIRTGAAAYARGRRQPVSTPVRDLLYVRHRSGPKNHVRL